MEGIDSPYINKFGSTTIPEPQSINALNITIPDTSPQFSFINMPSRPTSEMSSEFLSPLPPGGPPSLPHIEHTSPPQNYSSSSTINESTIAKL
jgi:hypothetical protein